MTAVTTKVKCLVQQPWKVAPPPCHRLPCLYLPCLAPPCHRPLYLETREKWTAKISSERPLTLRLTPGLFCIIPTARRVPKEGWTCSWAALRPNWLRQKWPKIPSDLPRARSHRPESGWGPLGLVRLPCVIQTFVFTLLHHHHRTRLAGPHIAGLRHLRRSWRQQGCEPPCK